MDIGIHAQLMAHHCVPRIAELVLRVPAEKPGDDNFQTRLISSIVHGSQMSTNCQYAEAREMMHVTTELFFAAATPDCFNLQNEAHRAIVSMAAHASQMAATVYEGAAEILSTVQPMADEALPATQRGLERLQERLEMARRKISDISHRALMERSRQNIGRSMAQRT
jgi:hypothetical protein